MKHFSKFIYSLKIVGISLYSAAALALVSQPPYGQGPDSTNIMPQNPSYTTLPATATVLFVVRNIFLWSGPAPLSTGWNEDWAYIQFWNPMPNISPGDPGLPYPFAWPTTVWIGGDPDKGAAMFVAKKCPNGKPAWLICIIEQIWDKGRNDSNFQGTKPLGYSGPTDYGGPNSGYSYYKVWNGLAIYRPGTDTGVYAQCTGYCDFIP